MVWCGEERRGPAGAGREAGAFMSDFRSARLEGAITAAAVLGKSAEDLWERLEAAHVALQALVGAADQVQAQPGSPEAAAGLARAWAAARGYLEGLPAQEREAGADAVLAEKVLGLFGTRYHDDRTCGACDGVLEVDRDAVCHLCSSGYVSKTMAIEEERHSRRSADNRVAELERELEEVREAARLYSSTAEGKLRHAEAMRDATERELAAARDVADTHRTAWSAVTQNHAGEVARLKDQLAEQRKELAEAREQRGEPVGPVSIDAGDEGGGAGG